MEDLYPIAEEGPKCRGRQSIKLRGRFEPQGDGLNAQLGRTFHKKKKIGRPTWVDTPRGYTTNHSFPFLLSFSSSRNAPVTIKSTHAHGKTSFLNDDDDDDITLTDDDDDVITCENAPPPP